MSTSQFCIQQRQQEHQKLKKIFVFSFASSVLLHGILAITFPRWSFESPTQTEQPMKLIIVDKPKPEPQPEPKTIAEPQPKPQPEPSPEPKTIVESQPKPQPEPVKTTTPQPSVEQPPVKPETAPPKQVLTNPTPAPSPAIAPPVEKTTRSTSSNNSSNNSVSPSPNSSNNSNADTSNNAIATNSTPPSPEPKPNSNEGISCISNCQPEYPAVLSGDEGSAGIKLTIDNSGNVTSATIATANSNNQINRQALLAARQMKFSSSNGSNAEVQVTINFTVAGSEYDRLARQQQREREQAQRKRSEQEAARQQQLQQEREARARQEQQQRQAEAEAEQKRQIELQQQQSVPDTQATPTAVPTEVDDEMLRKFRERIEQHQQQE